MLFLLVLLLKPVHLNQATSSLSAVPVGSPKSGYLYEGFESWPPAGFTLNPSSGTGAWLQSPVLTTSYISPQTGADGTSHAAEYDVWDYSSGTTGDMISNPVDLTGATSPFLKFYFWNHTDLTGYGNNDSTIVSISADNGNSWTTLAVLKGNVDNWTLHQYDLSSYIGSTILVRFRGVSDYGGSNMGIDEVEIGEKPPFDAGVSDIFAPDFYNPPSTPVAPSCGVSSIGTDTVNNFYVYCEVDSMGTVVYRDSVLINELYAGIVDTVTFTAFQPTPGMYYSFVFYTILTGDGFPLNDTLSRNSAFYSTQRIVVGELITNTGCSPCKPANDTLDQIFPDYPDSLALVRIHCWWPESSDPFYQYNTSMNASRINYYGADYAPHFYIDGDVDGDADPDSWRSMILEQMGKNSPLDITLSGVYDTSTAAGTLFVNVDATGEPMQANLYLRCCLVENGIQYNASNGQTVFYQVLRGLFPDGTGISLGALHKGDLVSHNIPFTIDTGTFNEDSLEFVVFVQSDDNKHILQGGKIALSQIPTGIATGQSTGLKFVALNRIAADVVVAKVYTPYTQGLHVRVLDISGRVVYSDYMTEGKGEYSLRITNLESGIYFLSVSSGGETIMERFTLLK